MQNSISRPGQLIGSVIWRAGMPASLVKGGAFLPVQAMSEELLRGLVFAVVGKCFKGQCA